MIFLDFLEFRIGTIQGVLQLDNLAVPDLGCFAEISFALCLLFFHSGFVNVGLGLTDGLDHIPLNGPLSFEGSEFVVQFAEFFVDLFQPFF